MTTTIQKKLTRQEALERMVLLSESGERTQPKLKEVIGEEWFTNFALLGYIRQGVAVLNGEVVRTYSATESGKKEKDFYHLSPSEKDKKLAKFLSEYV